MRERYPEGKILSALKESSRDHRVFYLALQRQIILCLIETLTSELYLIVRSPSERLHCEVLFLEGTSRLATSHPHTPSEVTHQPPLYPLRGNTTATLIPPQR